MKYGQIAGNDAINARIYQCFELISDQDARKFVKLFRTQDDSQRFHTFGELLVGAYLGSLPLPARYDMKTLGKTPDWTLLSEAAAPAGFIEVVTHQPPAEVSSSMATAIGNGEAWAGWIPENAPRLFQRLQEKSERYETLARQLRVPLVVAVIGNFFASVDVEEVKEALFGLHGGIFAHSKELAGVLYEAESRGARHFTYFANPTAEFSMPLHDADLPPAPQP